MHAERVRERRVGQLFDRREALLEKRDVLDPLDRKRADFEILRHVRKEVEAALRVGHAIGMHQVDLRPIAGLRVIREPGLTQMQGGFEGPRDELLLTRVVAPPQRVGLGGNDARQLIEEVPHVRRQHRGQFLERALDVVAKRRARQRFEKGAAEVQRAQLRHGEAGRESLERLTVHAPARFSVVVGLVVVEREARFLERLQVAPDRPRGDIAERGQLVDRDAGTARALDLTQDRPLPNHFGIAGHEAILHLQKLRI